MQLHRFGFRHILEGVPRSESVAEVVEHPSSSLDAQERRIRALEGQLVSVTAELSRQVTLYNTLRDDLMTAQAAFCERLKDSGIKAEPVRVPQELT